MKTATQLLGIMSPTTLAGLIADMRMMGSYDSEERALESQAVKILVANVGKEDAEAILSEFTTDNAVNGYTTPT